MKKHLFFKSRRFQLLLIFVILINFIGNAQSEPSSNPNFVITPRPVLLWKNLGSNGKDAETVLGIKPTYIVDVAYIILLKTNRLTYIELP